MTDHVSYDVAREQIRDGDLVLIWRPTGWHGFSTFFHAVMNFVTGSPVYHSTVALWMTSPTGQKRLMVVEQNMLGGKRIVPLSIYHDTKYYHKMEVFHLPDGATYVAMEDEVMSHATQGYGFFNLIAVGLNEFFGVKIKEAKNQVCSELSAACWIAAGVPLNGTLHSPAQLRGEVIKIVGEPVLSIDVE